MDLGMLTAFFLPSILRQKKQFKGIGLLIKLLDLSLTEVRDCAGVGEYDLIAWEKGKIHLTPKQMYDLEDNLEKQYFLNFKQEFDLKKLE